MRVSRFVGGVLLVCVSLAGQQPRVGNAAPPITLASWLNVEGTPPTLESLAGRVVMLEFWGTWCGPCVRAMPEVQKLHDRYRDRGLTVLAISHESTAVMQPFLEQHGYTMAVGSDPEKRVVAAYGIRGWPTTFVIGKDGKVAYVGGPYDAEAAIEQALGLESTPAVLLTGWLEAQRLGKDGQRSAMTRLLEKAPANFDLRAWARANGGAEAFAPAEPGAVDGLDLLRKLAASWHGKDAARRPSLLQQLADAGPTEFDLRGFVREQFGKTYPLDPKELKTLLEQQKYRDAVAAIAARNPSNAALAAATKDDGLVAFAKKQADDAKAMAKKGLMAQAWLFAGAQPKDNDAFFNELAMSGAATSPDKKRITGVALAGTLVTREQASAFVQDHLERALVMEALARRKAPPVGDLPKLTTQARERILDDLTSRYGKPEPRKD